MKLSNKIKTCFFSHILHLYTLYTLCQTTSTRLGCWHGMSSSARCPSMNLTSRFFRFTTSGFNIGKMCGKSPTGRDKRRLPQKRVKLGILARLTPPPTPRAVLLGSLGEAVLILFVQIVFIFGKIWMSVSIILKNGSSINQIRCHLSSSSSMKLKLC